MASKKQRSPVLPSLATSIEASSTRTGARVCTGEAAGKLPRSGSAQSTIPPMAVISPCSSVVLARPAPEQIAVPLTRTSHRTASPVKLTGPKLERRSLALSRAPEVKAGGSGWVATISSGYTTMPAGPVASSTVSPTKDLSAAALTPGFGSSA